MAISLRAALLAPILLTGCAGVASNMQGPLQPQAINGPCDLKRFFVVPQRTVPVQMTVAGAGQACSFVMFDPNLQLTLTAAFVTTPPRGGQAMAGLVNGGRQVAVSYTPAPGYAGPDRFVVIFQPGGNGIAVDVNVQPGR